MKNLNPNRWYFTFHEQGHIYSFFGRYSTAGAALDILTTLIVIKLPGSSPGRAKR